MKESIKRVLQLVLGFDNYLYLFAAFRARYFNEPDYLAFVSMLPERGVFVDVGANIGVTAAIARRARPNLSIVAIEPISDNLRAMRRLFAKLRLSDVQILPLAVGNTVGSVQFVMPVLHGVRMQGLSHVVHSSIGTFNEGATYSVEMKRLDDLGLSGVCAMKVDVENFEAYVFEGGRELMMRDRPIIFCELWDNDNRRRSIEVMRDYGYVVAVREGGRLIESSPDIKTQNFFFIPSERRTEFMLGVERCARSSRSSVLEILDSELG